MLTDRREKTKKIEGLVHILEEEYGSMALCPDDDNRLKFLNKVAMAPIVTLNKKIELNELEGDASVCRELAKKGYTIHEICNAVGLSYAVVKRVVSNIPKPPKFNHVLKSTKNVDTYFVTKSDLAEWRRENGITVHDLETGEHGYEIIHQRGIRWYDVPIGSLYYCRFKKYEKISEDFKKSIEIKRG